MKRDREQLELMKAIFERFSHLLRAKVGIALGVAIDALDGFELDDTDYRDSKQALEAIVDILDSTKYMTASPSPSRKLCRLSDLLSEVPQTDFGLGESDNVRVDIAPSRGERSICTSEIKRALSCLCRYVSMRTKRLKENDASLIEISLFPALRHGARSSDGGGAELFSVSLASTKGAEPRGPGNASSLRELGLRDQSIEALGLVFAEEVFKLHEAESSIRDDHCGNLAISVLFK